MKKTTFLSFCLIFFMLSGCGIGYQPIIQQGNIIKHKNLAKVKPGMTPTQVEVILGSPVLINTFSDSEWNYVYMVYKGRKKLHADRVIIHFKHGVVSNIQS